MQTLFSMHSKCSKKIHDIENDDVVLPFDICKNLADYLLCAALFQVVFQSSRMTSFGANKIRRIDRILSSRKKN